MERKVLKVKVQTINDVQKVSAYADKSSIYEQQALEHSNTAKKWAEQSEQSAINSENSAIRAEEVLEQIENNENISTVISNIEVINNVANNLEDIQTVEENKNIVLTQVSIAVEQANISRENAEISTNNASISTEQAQISTIQAQNSEHSANLAYQYSQIAKEQAESITNSVDIAETQANIATEQSALALGYSKNAKVSEENAKISETNAFNYAEQAKEYAESISGSGVSINVSETDNLTKENNVLKAFTEAGKGAITKQYARLLNLQQGEWKSLLTDTGVLILYKGSVSYRTVDGVNFQQVDLPSSPTAMAKNYETQTIYGAVPSSAGMWMYSKDDGVTWTYTSETSLSGYAWDNVVAKNNGSKKTGWNSSLAFTRSNSTTKNFANFVSSSNRFEMNNNSKNQIDFTTNMGYDYWCANTSGEIFKTSGSSTFTYYENTKAGLTCIKNCNNNIFCGFEDGSIAELVGYRQPWNFYTVASGEKVTDIVYKDGVYYVVTNNANYYTSTDLTTWTKFNGVASYGGTLEFTRFGIVLTNTTPAIVPSRQRIENALLDLHDLTDYAKVCGGGLKYENGQIQLDIVADIPLRLSQGRLNLFNIDKYYFSEEVKKSLISAIFSIDFCPADDYDTWLWADGETGYWYGEDWAGKSVLWIITNDGYIYDPVGYTWELNPVKYDVIRIVYDEWGNSCTGEIIGNLAPLKDLLNS